MGDDDLIVKIDFNGNLCKSTNSSDFFAKATMHLFSNFSAESFEIDVMAHPCYRSWSESNPIAGSFECAGKWSGKVSFMDIMPKVCQHDFKQLTATLVGDG